MTTTAALALLASVVAPFVVALIVRPTWSPNAKRNVAVGASVVLGVIAAITSGAVEGIPESVTTWAVRIVVTAGVVVSLAQGFYRALKTPADALEVASSPTPSEVATGN